MRRNVVSCRWFHETCEMNSFREFPQSVDLPDGEVWLLPNALAEELAARFVQHLRSGVVWTHEVYRGKETRRGTAWFADVGVEYRYSGQSMTGNGWDSEVDEVRQQVEQSCGVVFNSVLCNHYPDGRAQMGWHSDDEPELGENPVIASLSLGEPRAFQLKHKQSGEKREVLLEHNSLLVMAGELQHHWLHTLPRRSERVGERFNLTFRYTLPEFWAR